MMKSSNWKKYLFEFISIFVGVSLAFYLENWNENRREAESEFKTFLEIRNGLKNDLNDLKNNIEGHKKGVIAADYFRKIVAQKSKADTNFQQRYSELLRDFISVQNKSGYEALKSQGLELIKNDSLRLRIITVYDFYYEIIEKLEENYSEMQFHQSYFHQINDLFSSQYIISDEGNIVGLNSKLSFSIKDRNRLLSFFSTIKKNREFAILYYKEIIKQVETLLIYLEEEIKRLS